MNKQDFDMCDHPPRCLPEADCSREQEIWEEQCLNESIVPPTGLPEHKPVDAYSGPVLTVAPILLVFMGACFMFIGLTKRN
jgi:hypothetical protein